jgi:hypothetical protein
LQEGIDLTALPGLEGTYRPSGLGRYCRKAPTIIVLHRQYKHELFEIVECSPACKEEGFRGIRSIRYYFLVRIKFPIICGKYSILLDYRELTHLPLVMCKSTFVKGILSAK